MAKKKTYTVNSETGLNLRESPSKDAKVLSVLNYGDKVTAVQTEVPDGWVALDGGFVMAKFLK